MAAPQLPASHSDTPTKAPSQDSSTLNLISSVLDFIRGNLGNILETWGRDSPQYQSASVIMQAYLAENVKRIKGKVQEGEIEALMQGLSLEDRQGT
ncbi:uncharacterized protein A1O9_10972 [Exophiala aquamarina CBS 119918]|uniref:Uncharacterized protein n=1 Tax=Exophiala aquamarina CBS 119918 TaxID=1182545 RepID=A0A072NYV7_9EURO|nr:uncharacterized protein A1O9_10972 [Exophiala aquamarina CBS 119918]KEF53064.1 hypothetical protein A1O9_10972 [Exophiala aquamarina CBS 119918]